MSTPPGNQVPCPECGDHGVIPAGKFAPRGEMACDRCSGSGVVDRAELDEQP